MKVRPMQDRILVKRVEKEQKTAGGIFIPDTAREKPQEAVVIAVGPGRYLESGDLRKPGLKEGEVVMFGKYAGSEVKIDGEEHIILREDDILAVIE